MRFSCHPQLVDAMSVESMAVVLHHSRAKGAAKVVMIGIANHDGDGGSWPAMRTLAGYANVSPRRAIELVQQLEALGEIRVETNGGGLPSTSAYQRPNLYKVLLECPPTCSRDKNHTPLDKVRPVDNRAGRATAPLRDSAGGPLRDLAVEPSLEPSVEPLGGSPHVPTSPASYPQERSAPRNPLRCDDHQLVDVPPPCGACRRARLAHEQVIVHPPARQSLRPGDDCEHGYLADLCPHCPGGHLHHLEGSS